MTEYVSIDNIYAKESTWVKLGVFGNMGVYTNPCVLCMRYELLYLYPCHQLLRRGLGKIKYD